MQNHKFVFVINRLKLGGAQRVVITLAHAIRDLGHEVHVICFKKSDELCGAENLKVHYFDRGLSLLPQMIRNRVLARRLDAYIRNNIGSPNLVLSNLSKANQILIHSTLPNVHIVVHNTLSLPAEIDKVSRISRWARSRKLRSSYLKKPCVCCGNGVYQNFVDLMPDHENVIQIGNPADIEQIHSWSREHASPYENYIVHIGSFVPQKRHDRLLQAYKESGIDESLVLIGSGKLEPEVRQQAQLLGIDKKVIFAGFHSNPYPLLARAKLLVLSSDYEGLPVVLLESLALGVPTISTDCESGPREVLPRTNLAPVDDVTALAELMKAAVNDPAGYSTALPEEFDSRVVANAYLKLVS